MKKGILAVCVASAFLVGCIEKKLSPEELAVVSALQEQLELTQEAISEASTQDARYSGGLIKGLIGVRLEVLKTNEALIQQRIHAIEGRGPVKTQTLVTATDSVLAETLSQELSQARAEIMLAKAEASAYSGGLIGVMKESAVATKQSTIAMLEQRYLSAKYGLLPPAFASQSAEPLSGTGRETPRPAAAELSPPADGPFGLAKGLSVSDIEAMIGTALPLVDGNQNLYSSTTAPKENAAFETYAMVISPVAGLCQIRAVGKDISANSFGSQIRTAYDGLQLSLTNVYGVPETLDRLLPGSIWKDPDDWMMALHKEERYLVSEWEANEASPLPNNIQRIVLTPRTTSGSNAYLFLQYSFDNDELCRQEIESKNRESL